MDRTIVYPGAVPLETDLLRTNRFSMTALAMLTQDLIGTSTQASGFTCVPTGPASLAVQVTPGRLYSLQNLDGTAYSSLAADTTHQIVKQGILLDAVTLACAAPATAGFSVNYLIQATYLDSDTALVTLPYYNSSNPSQAYSGPANSGTPQATLRAGTVSLQAKVGIAAATGSQTTPAPDAGYVGLFAVTVANGTTTITSGSISTYSGYPNLGFGADRSTYSPTYTYPVATLGWRNTGLESVTDYFSQVQATDWLSGAPVVDTTAVFNTALGASTAYSIALWGKLAVPGMSFIVGGVAGGPASIFVRKGQHLQGSGMGATRLDAQSAHALNTAATIILGTSSAGVVDSGGQAAEVSELMFLGGPSGFPNIDTTQCAGWSVHEVFCSFPGQGVLAGGADGKLSDSIFDGGLNQIVVTGQNIQLNDNLHYLGNYQISVNSGNDITITGMQSEYAEYASLLLNPTTSSINVGVESSNFIGNTQYGTYQGAILIGGNGVDVSVSNSRFRNLPGMAVAYSTGVGCKLTVGGNTIIDGLATSSAYTQSTTMGGIDCSNMNATISDTTLRNLPGQPILIGGTLAITVIIDGCRFSGNTGGSSEILITNTNAASKVVIRNCIGGGRPLVNSQSTVTVVYDTNVDATAPIAITLVTTATATLTVANKVVGCNFAGTVTLTLPSPAIYPGKTIQVQTYTANAVVSASANVSPLTSPTPGTAILAAIAGKWATLVSNGTSWVVTAGN